SVTDTGIGIPADKHHMVFETFKQVDGATMRKYGGTGLGLSICREVIKLLGGWITFDSSEGQGSTFTVFLPSITEELIPQTALVEQEAVMTVESQVSSENRTKTVFHDKCILIVDDDYRNIYGLRQALEQKGVHILEASNGIECLNILQNATRVDA